MNSRDWVPICAGNSSYIKTASNDFKLPLAVKMLGEKIVPYKQQNIVDSKAIQHSDSSKPCLFPTHNSTHLLLFQ